MESLEEPTLHQRDHKYIALWDTQLASRVQHLCRYYSMHIVYTSRLHNQAYTDDREKKPNAMATPVNVEN